MPFLWTEKYPKGYKTATSREVDPILRKMVLGRDNWTCQKCGATIDDDELHCHHILPVASEPMLQNDMSNCITVCKRCHKKIHTEIAGCGYAELKCGS